MLKRELKINFKTFAIWTSILLGIFLVVFLLYPSIVSDQNIEMLNEMDEKRFLNTTFELFKIADTVDDVLNYLE